MSSLKFNISLLNLGKKFIIAGLSLLHSHIISDRFVAEIFTGTPGKYVSLDDTIKAFKGLLAGDYDHLPEQAFYMVGTIEEAVEKAKTL